MQITFKAVNSTKHDFVDFYTTIYWALGKIYAWENLGKE